MNRGKKQLLYALCVVCTLGVATCGWRIYRELKPRSEAERFYVKVREQAFPRLRENSGDIAKMSGEMRETNKVPERGRLDFDALRAVNPDICGWIYCPGTVIDYPVVQGKDNDWYLNHTIDQEKSVVGSIFLESRNRSDFSDDVSVIYGHHIRGGRMFTPISGYKEQSYYEEHPRMYLYTPEADYCVEIFAGEILDGSTGSFPLQFKDEAERRDWIGRLMGRSTFRGAELPGSEEKILALCTCTYEYQDARYAVYGRLTEIGIEEKEERSIHDVEEERNPKDNSADLMHPDDDTNTRDDGIS